MNYSRACQLSDISEEEIRVAKKIVNEVFPKYIQKVLADNYDKISELFKEEIKDLSSESAKDFLYSKTLELVERCYYDHSRTIGVNVASGMRPTPSFKLGWEKANFLDPSDGKWYGPISLTREGKSIVRGLDRLISAV